MLDDAGRQDCREADKRLIACEKAGGGTGSVTLLVGEQFEGNEKGYPAHLLPYGLEDVFRRLETAEDQAPIEVIIDPETWSTALGELLAALRDRANRRILVHVGEARIGETIDQQLVSLGYRRLAADEALYLFDIDTYKDTPDWLNPRNWANPELWGKYRW